PFFVRGYDDLSRDRVGNISFDDLMGSRVLVGNFELRLPFTGPEKLATIKSGLLFSDLHLFLDAGLAWNSGNKIVSSLDKKPLVEQYYSDGTRVEDETARPILAYDRNYRVPVFSAGVSRRVKLFGA